MHLIVELYRAAQEMPVDEFREFSMGLLNSLVPFDSARFVGGLLALQGLQIEEFFLHNKPIEAIIDYATVTQADPVLRAVRANPGRMIRFHPPLYLLARKNARCLIMPNGTNMGMACL